MDLQFMYKLGQLAFSVANPVDRIVVGRLTQIPYFHRAFINQLLHSLFILLVLTIVTTFFLSNNSNDLLITYKSI